MNTAIFYDFETSGLVDFKARSSADHQPHIVQVAAAMVDLDTRKIIQAIDLIVKPQGWEITKETSDIHGITHDYAMEVGMPEDVVTNMFFMFWDGRLRIGHNESFDARIMRIAISRFLDDEDPLALPFADIWKAGESQCTMKLSKPILKLPPTEKMKKTNFKNSFKPPKLSEAYKYFTNKELDGAHNAMVDVKGCIDVYFGALDYEEQGHVH